MKIIIPGHEYALHNTQGEEHVTISFIDKTGKQPIEGTTNEEVLEMLIDRINFLNNLLPCTENGIALHHLREALSILNARTEDRKRRGVEGQSLK